MLHSLPQNNSINDWLDRAEMRLRSLEDRVHALSGNEAFPSSAGIPILDGLNLGAVTGATAGQIRMTDRIRVYNNLTTIQNGVPSILATYDSGVQSAAIGSTLLYTPVANSLGVARISWHAIVIRAATTSSILGPLTLNYTDAGTVVATTMICGGFTEAGAAGTTNAGNTANATKIQGTTIINAWTAALNFTFGYTSVGATTMQYAFNIRFEFIR